MRFSRWGARVSFRRHRTCDRMKPRRYVQLPDLSRCSNIRCRKLGYSITSSAMLSSPDERVRLSALAVFILITNSNLVGC